MNDTKKSPHERNIPFLTLFISVATAWTVAAAVVLIEDLNDRTSFLNSNALSTARATYEKDVAFRRWAARHGGVYVPATAETPPNPYLKVPERDITTPSGRQLTLMNPAYINRQLYEISQTYSEAPQGHITSLNPIRPGNAPDPWERKALEAFEKGVPEFSEFQTVDGKLFFRFMRPLKTEKPCLKCHAVQGYREGDTRGGISVSIPVTELAKSTYRSSVWHIMTIVLVWLMGIGGLWFSLRRIGLSSLALQKSEERYRQQFQQCGAVMLIVDPESGAIVDANPSACSFYGYSCEDLRKMKISDINTSPPAELASRIAGVRDCSIRQFTARHRLADGSLCDVEVFSNPVLFRDKTLLHSIVIDITERLMAVQELRDKMNFAENLVLNSTTPTFVINSDHQVLIWNRALEELTGVKAQQVIGTDEQWRAFYPSERQCLADIVIDENLDEARSLYSHISSSRLIPDCLRAEGDYSFDARRCRLVFSSAPVRDRSGEIIAAIETLEDITERISLETQLFQAQKMESVGELASGIAHDFNNVLTVINGYAELLKMILPDHVESQFVAGEILASVDRGAGMTRSLLAFSGKHEMQLQYEDLNQILLAIRKSLGRLIREDLTLTIRPGEERLPVYVDRVQIEQVLINLVVNARDALGTGGTISVLTMPVHIKETRTEGNTVIPPGQYACLSVSDNGSGMDAKTLERIFEPFYTTKEKGKGTGLGLSIVSSIVTKLNGRISVATAVGRGTEFRVYLPLYAGDKYRGPAEVEQTISHYGSETVLVAEDDAAIMKLHREVLSRHGYTVLTASDGAEAMEVFNAHRDRIRILLVDVIMPRLNGREVAEQIRRQRPDLPIIMTSGYTDDIIDRTTIDDLKVMFLQKPVKPLDLLAAIRSSLLPNI